MNEITPAGDGPVEALRDLQARIQEDGSVAQEIRQELQEFRPTPEMRAAALATAIAGEMRRAISNGGFATLQNALKQEGFYVEIRKPVKKALRQAGVRV